MLPTMVAPSTSIPQPAAVMAPLAAKMAVQNRSAARSSPGADDTDGYTYSTRSPKSAATLSALCQKYATTAKRECPLHAATM